MESNANMTREIRSLYGQLTREIEIVKDMSESYIDKAYNNYDKETRIKMVDEQNKVFDKMIDDLVVAHAEKCAKILQKYTSN